MYFNRSDRIKTLRWMLRVLLGSALLVAIIGIPDGAPLAQTSNSLRIRSMGDSFAGIIEDPHTDAYLNPARVGDLRDRQIYMARLPSTSLTFNYPDNSGMSSYGVSVLPPETVPGNLRYEWREYFTPYTIGFITPLSGSTKLSFSLDAAADGYEELSSSNRLRIDPYGMGDDDIETDVYASGWEHSLYHVVADAAIGTGDPESEGTRVGIRVRVGYDQMQFGRVRVDQSTRAIYPDLDEWSLRYVYDREKGDYEKTSALLSVGLSRNSGIFAQAVIGGGWQHENLTNNDFRRSIDDEDYDGNGVGHYGDSTPYFRSINQEFDAFRSYDSSFMFGRLGLRWSDRVRSFHRVSWGQSDGSGNGVVQQAFYRAESIVMDDESVAVSYDIDGNSTWFSTDHSIGYVDTIGDHLQIALGVRARIEYEELEEDGDGIGSLSFAEEASSISYESSYYQQATYTREYWLLGLPMGVEWRLHKNVAWRFGTQIRATRLDDGGEIKREIDFLEDAEFDETLSYGDIEKRIIYGTSLYFSMGFGFTFRDKLSIDLLTAATTGSFNAATVASAQVKFFF